MMASGDRSDLFSRAVSTVRAHLLDDYRSERSWSLCGRDATGWRSATNQELCRSCLRFCERYPTRAEFFAYHACTDCGRDTWNRGEGNYAVRQSVWNMAYPAYRSGVGVGSSRPCLSCLSSRLGRELCEEDFLLRPTKDASAP